MSDSIQAGALLDSERHLLAYAADLQRFADDPQVAEQLINLHYNLLFRARGFGPDTISMILNRTATLADLHPMIAAVQGSALDAVVVALGAIAPERTAEALDLYQRLRALLQNQSIPCPQAHEDLARALGVLFSTATTAHPAVTFALWSEAVGFASKAPDSIILKTWIPLAIETATRLAAKDALAAFVVWNQAITWSRSVGFDVQTASALLVSAYRLVRPNPDEGRGTNEVLWAFIRNGDGMRDTPEVGREARMVSVLAAFDMARYLFESSSEKRKAALEKLRSQGEAALEAAGNDERVLEEYERPIAEVLSLATRWLNEDLVLHEAWKQLLQAFQRQVGSPLAESASFKQFVKSVAEVQSSANRRNAAAAKAEVHLVEGEPVAWIDTPLIPLPWLDVEEPEQIRNSVCLLVTPGGPLQGNGVTIERLRRADPSFYPEAALFEAQVRTPEDKRGIVSFIVVHEEDLVIIDSSSNPIHAINRAGLLKGFDDASKVMDYVVFFTSAVWGDDGPFRIIRAFEDIPFVELPTAQVEQKIRDSIIRSPEPYTDLDEAWRVKVTVLYSNILFDVVFEVGLDGVMKMLDDTQIASDLSVKKLTMTGVMRCAVPPSTH
jgi:hypothetical protein